MQAHYEMLWGLCDEADGIYKVGTSGRNHDIAILKYASFKSALPEYIKKSEKEWKGQPAPWYVNAYQNALRKAHIALKSPANTSPSNPKWAPCVSAARFELDYVLKQIAEAMKAEKI